MSFIEVLEKLDKLAFIVIHNDADFRIFDQVMVVLRNPFTWIPLYVLILCYGIKMGGVKGLLFIVCTFAVFAMADFVSASVLKSFFARERPCYDPELGPFIRHLVDCGGRNSFPSSHAANHFGLAAFWFFSAAEPARKKWQWVWIWASLICYAQVYVGKHFPLDVLAGALLGLLIGALMAFFFNSKTRVLLKGQDNQIISTNV